MNDKYSLRVGGLERKKMEMLLPPSAQILIIRKLYKKKHTRYCLIGISLKNVLPLFKPSLTMQKSRRRTRVRRRDFHFSIPSRDLFSSSSIYFTTVLELVVK